MTGAKCAFVNAAGAVPRTTAMALSNTLVTMFDDITKLLGRLVNSNKIASGHAMCSIHIFGPHSECASSCKFGYAPC